MTGAPLVSQCDLKYAGISAENVAGAFVAAPVGGLLWGFGAFALRISVQWILAKVRGHRFDAFDRPPIADPSFLTGPRERSSDENDREPAPIVKASSLKGKFL